MTCHFVKLKIAKAVLLKCRGSVSEAPSDKLSFICYVLLNYAIYQCSSSTFIIICRQSYCFIVSVALDTALEPSGGPVVNCIIWNYTLRSYKLLSTIFTLLIYYYNYYLKLIKTSYVYVFFPPVSSCGICVSHLFSFLSGWIICCHPNKQFFIIRLFDTNKHKKIYRADKQQQHLYVSSAIIWCEQFHCTS